MVTEETFKQMELDTTKKFRGYELACISRMKFHSGIDRKEIVNLKLKDCFDSKGRPLDFIQTSRASLPVCEELKEVLGDYYARYNGEISPNNPMFPGYLSIRTLSRHWKKNYGTNSIEIQDAGLKFYRNKLRRDGVDNQKIIGLIAKQFVMSEVQARKILLGNKPLDHGYKTKQRDKKLKESCGE